MRFQRVTIFCPFCGEPREVTRRVRHKTCSRCAAEAIRKVRQVARAQSISAWLAKQQHPVIPKLVQRVLEAQYKMRHEALLNRQRARAGK